MQPTRSMPVVRRGLVLCACVLAVTATAVRAQTPAPSDRPPITLEVRSFIYADNTEFLENP